MFDYRKSSAQLCHVHIHYIRNYHFYGQITNERTFSQNFTFLTMEKCMNLDKDSLLPVEFSFQNVDFRVVFMHT